MILNVGAGGGSSAKAIKYDNSKSKLNATDVQGAVDEVNESLVAEDNLKFQFATDGEGNYGYLGADDSFIPFKSNAYNLLEFILKKEDESLSYSVEEKGLYMVLVCGGIYSTDNINNEIPITTSGTVEQTMFESSSEAGSYRMARCSILNCNKGDTINVEYRSAPWETSYSNFKVYVLKMPNLMTIKRMVVGYEGNTSGNVTLEQGQSVLYASNKKNADFLSPYMSINISYTTYLGYALSLGANPYFTIGTSDNWGWWCYVIFE